MHLLWRRIAGIGAMLIAGLAVSAPASAATGDLFSFAEQTDSGNGSSAPAFPDTRAWWAGVCNLRSADFMVGADPGMRFPNCIDHPVSPRLPDNSSDQLQPPLSTGVTPNPGGLVGWARQWSQTPGGPSWRLADVTQAGAHPDGSASFWFSRDKDFKDANIPGTRHGPDGAPRDIRVSLPPGVIGDPNAIPKCPAEALNTSPTTCPPKTQVGVSTVSLGGYTAVWPVYNVEARDGMTAELIISGVGVSLAYQTNAPVVASARTDGDFGVDAFATEIPTPTVLHGQTFTLWGVPWAASHDPYRPVTAYCHTLGTDPFGATSWLTPGLPVQGLPGGIQAGCSQNPVHYDPSWGPIKPFLTLQTDCTAPNAERNTHIRATNYHTPVVAEEDSIAPQLDGCDDIQFDNKADYGMTPTSTAADSATGLNVEVTVEQNDEPPTGVRFDPDDDGAPAHWNSPAGLATSHLDQTIVRLPEGVAVNPSGASGLAGCSDSQIGVRQLGNPPLFNDSDPFDGDASDGVECPQSSIVGTVEVETSLLDEPLTGEVVLGAPKKVDHDGNPATPPRFVPESGEMLRLFLVVRNRERGLLAKVFGSTTADPATGRLTANFDQNPRVPFDRITLKMKGGDRGLLALQQRCDSRGWSSELRPWSGGDPAVNDGAFATSSNCGYGFSPKLAAGLSNSQGGGSGAFSFSFSRVDGEQWFKGLTAKLPTGLLASVRDVPLCTRAQADAGTCPIESRIGTVDAAAGSGDPFVLDKKGDAYLTEGFKGCAYGLLVRVPVEAGPFRGDLALDPIVVRQAICVDPTTAAVTAISDPLPQIWFGIPVRLREATVKVDRPGFMRAPTSCAPKQIAADLTSIEGANASLSQPFQASGCGTLPFKPKLALRLTGRKQTTTGKHPGVRAVVTQRVGEAGFKKAVVQLPKSLALDPDNAQALCEFADGTKPDLEKHCPKGSIIGRARAMSPLLKRPLAGDVYFVKNIRRDPTTGNAIRTLPMIIVALRGEISVNLKGESDTTKAGELVNTFANVPDAPVSQFNLNINGGKNGILAVTRTRRSKINVCRGVHLAEVDTDGQNGRQRDFDVRLKTPRCAKAKHGSKASCRTAKQRREMVCRGIAAAKRVAARSQQAAASA